MLPPPPILNNGANLANKPPFLDKTTPFLTHTVRPDLEYFNASFSQFSHTFDRNPVPFSAASVNCVVVSLKP